MKRWKVRFEKRAKHNEECLFRRVENFKGLLTDHLHEHVQQAPVESSASASDSQRFYDERAEKHMCTIQSLHQCHASLASL